MSSDPQRLSGPPPRYLVVGATRTNGFAVASLVLGIVWLLGLGSILAIIFGHVALRQISRDASQTGKGMAVAGLALGYSTLILILILLLIARLLFGAGFGGLYS
jgi:hypothetical protein